MEQQEEKAANRSRLNEVVDLANTIIELNKQSLIQVDNEIKRAQETKAWKAMLLLRRINEQVVKGSASEKKKFYRWVKNKLQKKPIAKELELAHFSPIREVKLNQLNLHETKLLARDETTHAPIEFDAQFTRYQLPKEVDVFRFPVIEWDFRWQRPQQFSTQFAAHGHRVFYFSIDTLETERDDLTYEELCERVSIRQLARNVWGVRLCSYQRLNVYRNVLDHPIDLKYLQWSLDYLKERFQIGHTVSILDLPFWAPLAERLEQNKVVYDCMDDHAGFSTNSAQMLSTEEQLVRSAELVITSSQRLYDKIKAQNEATVLIRNAGQFEHFAMAPANLAPEVSRRKGPVIGYYGAISEWFDIKMVEQLAKRNKGWTFVLVGDTFNCDVSQVEMLENVILTGEKPYGELPNYLYGFDVCLIPFLVNDLTLATNPVKVYEYLASGKPVVSTKLPELEVISDVVDLATSVEEFEQAIRKHLNQAEERTIEVRKEFAAQNTWKARYLDLKREIDRRFFPKVSIVIVTYNNWALTKQCLDSLFANNEYPNVEIIVVDNDSTDETPLQLARLRHPQLKVILSPVNTGFAGGNSMGCQAATGEFIILLNNDTIVPRGWIQRLIRPLQQDRSLGMVGPMSNSVGNDQMLDHFIGNPIDGPDLDWLNEFYQNYQGRVRATEMLGFYCVAMTREAYERVGDLDISYGIGMFEDDDYCERVRRAGYKLGIAEDAFVYHHGSASFKKLENAQYRAIWEHNKRLFERKWSKPWQMPKPPASIFFDTVDEETTAQAVRHFAGKSILILGGPDWQAKHQRWQELTCQLADQGHLVIAYVQAFHGKELVGTRKVGPSLYLTNRVDLFAQTDFDLVLYCGAEQPISNLRAATVADVAVLEEPDVEAVLALLQ